MIVVTAILLATAAVSSVAAFNHENAYHLPNVVAVHMQPHVPCAKTMEAILGAAGCDVVFRVDIQTKLASMCSYEIMNTCDHLSVASGTEGHVASFPVSRMSRRTAYTTQSKSHTSTSTAELDVIHNITGVLEARHKLGLTGEGIKVALLDGGVDYLHPALGGGFGPGYKVAFGYDLVGDNYDGLNPLTLAPDNDPFDNCTTSGYGTLMAGVVGANATDISTPGFIPAFPFTGVAPGATLGAYRVYGCAGYSTNDIFAAAILRAADDGADIIHVSVGSPGYADSAAAAAAALATDAGHIVVARNGNDGVAGAFIPSSPGLGGLGIASITNVAIPGLGIHVDGVMYPYLLGVNNGNFTFDTPYSGEIVVNNPNAAKDHVLDDGCKEVNVNVTGKAVLLYWGEPNFCSSKSRCDTAFDAGAVACIIYYNSDALSSFGTLGGSASIPSLMTTLAAGQAILADLAENKSPEIIPTLNYSIFPAVNGPTVYLTSSPGLSNELFLKPDLGGIGESVYSTISLHAAAAGSPYAVSSGSDVASAYVAGCLALLLQKRGKISFDAARAYLQNTATVTNILNSALVHSPAYQGAGLVNVYEAAVTNTLVTPSSLSLNDTANHKRAEQIRVHNNYDTSVTYYLSHIPAATVNAFNSGDDLVLDRFLTTFTADNVATVKFGSRGSGSHGVKAPKRSKGDIMARGEGGKKSSKGGKGRTRKLKKSNKLKQGGKGKADKGTGSESEGPAYAVTVEPGKSVTIRLDFTAPIPASPDLWPLYGGYIAITNSFDDFVSHVPYAGVAGIWKDRPIWVRNSTTLYNRWALQDPKGPLAQFGSTPGSVATGLYANTNQTTLAPYDVIDISNVAQIFGAVASDTRAANVTITYLCEDDSELQALGLQRTNFVAARDTSSLAAFLAGYLPVANRALTRSTDLSIGFNVVPPRPLGFQGKVFIDDLFNETADLPFGVYQMKFSARRPFGDETELDVVTTPPFQLTNSSDSLSEEVLAGCQV